jgi:acyl-CoA reductase-like NAD-dependent aldehyde dehydrogenase
MSDTTVAPWSAANFVAGGWQPARSGATYENRNPMRPDDLVGEFADSSAEDVAEAIAAAEAAAPGWAALPMAARAQILQRAAAIIEARQEQLAQDMTREMGKPLREARGEWGRCAQILRFAAGEAQRPVGELYEQTGGGTVTTRRRPVGIVGLITPWNFPAAIPVWKSAPALIQGNVIVLKLAIDAPLSGLHVAEVLTEAGLPQGVFNVVTGSGATAGAALVADPRVRAISFTGSVGVGQQVREAATSRGARVQLELGGQNPMIVLADADLPRAVEAAYAGAFWSAGQKCTATRRIYVEAAAREQFEQLLLQRIDRGVVGDPMDAATEVGPIVSAAQLDNVLGAIAEAERDGARRLVGGERLDDDNYLMSPTVFADPADSSLLSRQEVFGPVTSLFSVDGLDEALARANAVEFGLCAALYTTSIAAATRFETELRAGILHVNSQTAGAEAHVPFGGIKSSGFGPHEQGRAAAEFYTDVVTVYHDA